MLPISESQDIMFHSDKSQDVWEKTAAALRQEKYVQAEALVDGNMDMLRAGQDDMRFLFYLSMHCPQTMLKRIVEKHYAHIRAEESYGPRIATFMQAIWTAEPYSRQMTPQKIDMLHHHFAHS